MSVDQPERQCFTGCGKYNDTPDWLNHPAAYFTDNGDTTWWCAFCLSLRNEYGFERGLRFCHRQNEIMRRWRRTQYRQQEEKMFQLYEQLTTEEKS